MDPSQVSNPWQAMVLVVQILTGFATTAIGIWVAYQLRIVHTAVNSGLDALLKARSELGHAAGMAEGRAEGKQESDRRSDSLATLGSRMDVLWDFVRRRATSEFIAQKMGPSAFPPELYPEKRKFYEPLADDLKQFYNSAGSALAEPDLFGALEKIFGERIVQHVCVPLGLHAGACILGAMAVCREGNKEPPAAATTTGGGRQP